MLKISEAQRVGIVLTSATVLYIILMNEQFFGKSMKKTLKFLSILTAVIILISCCSCKKT